MISFSGIDGAGKTTQIELFEKYCMEKNIKTKRIWARGRCTPGVIFIKNIVRKDKNLDEEGKKEYRDAIHKSPKKRKFLLIASICDFLWYFGLYYRIVNMCNTVFICDRYLWDTYIDFKVDYSEFDFEKWFIWRLLIKIALKPEKSFVFIISPEESIRRGIQKNEAGMETHEQKDKKIKMFSELINQGKWSNVIEGTRTIDNIFEEIKKEVLNEY